MASNPADGTETAGIDLGSDLIPYCDHKYNIGIQRSPFDRRNFKAYRQLKRILKENRFDLIHCHTPMGGVLTRLAAKKYRKSGTKVLYTAHGFHFYEGGPASGWRIYYPIERHFSRFTDGLITINSTDYKIAAGRFHAKETYLSKGVGYDESRFFMHDREERGRLRAEYGYGENKILLVYVAELNPDKNQEVLLRMLKSLLDHVPDAKLLLAGRDATGGHYESLAYELGIDHAVDFLGQRDDIDRIIPMCDVTTASSIREGLGINLLESMACGVPVIAAMSNGHRELIQDEENGLLVPGKDAEAFAKSVRNLLSDTDMYKKFRENGLITASQYTTGEAVTTLESIYSECCSL